MEETRERIGERVEISWQEGSQATASSSLRLPRFLGESRLSAADLGAAVVEWAASVFDSERGFLVAVSNRGGEGEVAGVIAGRSRGDGSEWSDVQNPELAVNRSVAVRASMAASPIAVDSLTPEEGDESSTRAVIAASFELNESVRGVLCIDRPLSVDGIEEEDLVRFGSLVEVSAPSLARAFLREELERVRAELRETTGEEEEEEEESEDRFRGVETYHGIVGTDEKLRKVFHIVEKVKNSDLNVCIFGESGTGKELVARAIHSASERVEHQFVSENCGAISETLLESELFGHVKGAFTGADEDKQGLFEAAHKGTLFLDEISDMSEGMQRKLLRALQEGVIRPIGGKQNIEVDVRVICASNRDLKLLVKEGEFRADLYYRLNVIQLQLPPLRERRGDIEALISHFSKEIMEQEGIRKRFSDSASRALCQYSWPGNVRELRNVIRRVLLTATRRVIARKDVLPFLASAEAASCLGENVGRDDDHMVLRIPLRRHFNDIIDECERLVLVNALKENAWNKSRVTKALGIPRQSLYNKIAKFDLRQEWESE
ncbi:MAG: sigma-54 dependent transcriptional regulator [Planctomycetota bacterium]